jgi:hypothetical protein
VATYRSKGLNATQMKTIAIIAMLIDHMTWAFVETNTPLAAILHAVGRLTGPTMFFFIAEGYYHTHDLKKYIERLALFALISHVPYNLFINQGNALTLFPTSVIFTLLCGLLALHAYHTIQKPVLKFLCIVALCLITIGADWGIFGVICILVFGIFRDQQKKREVNYSLLSGLYILTNFPDLVAIPPLYYHFLYRFGLFFLIPFLRCYNGERGGNRFTKWMFYIIYPLQFLAIGGIWLLIGN